MYRTPLILHYEIKRFKCCSAERKMIMRMWIEITSVMLLAACMTCSGCSDSDWSTDPPSPDKIAATNKVRQKLGIRQMKDNWTFYGREFGCEKWKETQNALCKRVKYDKEYETILWEEDRYYTGRQILTPDREAGLVSECLSVYYDYRSDRFSLTVSTDDEDIMAMENALIETTPEGKSFGFNARTNEETLEVADKILKKWNLKRL